MRVIYLHGFASGPTSSKARFFVEKFRSAGVGVSVPALDGGDFPNLTVSSQLAILDREAGREQVVLMGSSLGGYLAALYAARHPDTVERIVLMAPAFCFASRWSSDTSPEMAVWKRAGVTEIFHYGEKRQREISYQLIVDGLAYEDYPVVTQPALVLHGALDPVVPVSLSQQFAGRFPHTKLRVYPQSGHELTDVVEDMWTEVSGFLGLESKQE